MYQNYFGMTETPFSIAPNPRYLYMSLRHQEALATLQYGLSCDGGFVLLTGEVGAGKTTICRCLLEQIPHNCDIAYIFNPKLTVMELLSTVCDEFHIKYPKGTVSIKQFVDLINGYLLKSHANGRKAVLIIDEAQNLSADVLEQMRLLTNLETNERKLLQILLVGQPELAEIVERPELRQLAQRIVARYHLKPLTKVEVRAYVKFRLEMAGVQRSLFSDRILNKLYQLSGGVPRLINLLCDRALLGTYVQGKDKVDRTTLLQAAREVQSTQTGRHITQEKYAFLLVSLVVATVLGIIYYQAVRVPVAQTKQKVATQATESTSSVLHTESQKLHDYSAKTVTNDGTGTPSIALPMNDTYANSKSIADSALLRSWGRPYQEGVPLCEQAVQAGLRCWSMRGGLDEIRALNVPVTLEMLSADGEKFYATLVRLGNQSATFDFGTTTSTAKLSSLAYQWTGNYNLISRIPAEVHENIANGERGASVDWLSQQLAKLQGVQINNSPATFDEQLRRRVQQFQLTQGLVPYGNAGPKTMMHLSAMADAAAPHLSSTD